ncbi:hypothetical protein [Aquimarina sp. I32.4]|uniref:hypothetical protein n=1 Tax=Aquimarina sp. I32.4 TaxID=2053903 RepID=UPI000CDEE7D0|nr:hypothetical protein [Aquimarina sp. I32.4]
MAYSNKTEEKKDLKMHIVNNVPSSELEDILTLYSRSVAIESYVKIPFIFIAVLFLVHNIFLAGRSFDYSTYETIKTVELSIAGVIVIVVFIMAGIAIDKNIKVNKLLKQIGTQYHIDIQTVQDEFNAIAIHLFGGRGVTLKKSKNHKTLH